LDLPATWLDAAGVAVPREMEGRSFLARIGGRTGPTREAVFAERDWHDTQDAIRAVRTPGFALIQNYRAEVAYQPTDDVTDSITWKSILELDRAGKLPKPLHERWFVAPRPRVELYDLGKDAGETKNVAS